MNPEGPLQPPEKISSADIYHRLGSLEGKMDSLLLNQANQKEDIEECFKRINDLERNMNKTIGIGLVACIAIPSIIALTQTLLSNQTSVTRNFQQRPSLHLKE